MASGEWLDRLWAFWRDLWNPGKPICEIHHWTRDKHGLYCQQCFIRPQDIHLRPVWTRDRPER